MPSKLPQKKQPAQVPENVQRAAQVTQLAHRSARQMIQQVRRGLDVIWNSPDPAGVLEALGTDAGIVFQLNNDTLTFLATTLAGSEYEDQVNEIIARVADLPALTIAADGKVTLD